MNTSLNIRKIIAERLTYELDRRGLNLNTASKKINISKNTLGKYLEGQREIQINEISQICDSIGANSVRLLYSEVYPTPKLSFRDTSNEIQILASRIEDAFLTIGEHLPEVNLAPIHNVKRTAIDRGADAVMVDAAKRADEVRKICKTPELFIKQFNVPVIPIHASNSGFDGFLISHGRHQAICVNSNKPPHRIRFTLCHEIAHLIFDQDVNIPIDTFLPNLYREKYSKNEMPEFYAYKFAQFYLLPLTALETHVTQSWPNLNNEKLQKLLDVRQTSKDVLTNVIYDILKLGDQLRKFDRTDYQGPRGSGHQQSAIGDQLRKREWEEGLDKVWDEEKPWYEKDGFEGGTSYPMIKQYCKAFTSSTNAREIYSFLNSHKQGLKNLIQSNRYDYSSGVFDFLMETFQLELH